MLLFVLISSVLSRSENACEYEIPVMSGCPHPTKEFLNTFYNSNHTTAPDQSCNVCPDAARLHHSIIFEEGMRETYVHFQNDAAEPVLTYWVSPKGAEVPKETIPPLGRLRVKSYEGHVFRFYNQKGDLLLEYLVGLYPLFNENSVKSDVNTATGDLEENDIDREGEPDWNTVLPTGFVNRAGYNIDLYWDGFNGQELAGQLQPGQVHREYTYEKHTFSAWIHHSKEIVSRVAIGAVHIPDCPRYRRTCDEEIPIVEPIYLVEPDSVCVEDNSI